MGSSETERWIIPFKKFGRLKVNAVNEAFWKAFLFK